MADVLYLLWSGRHRAWWRPDALGYTALAAEAGRYSEADAVRYVTASAQCGIREQVTTMVAAPENWTGELQDEQKAVRAAARAGRAVDEHGTPWWIHDCGTPMTSAERPGPHACPWCDHAPAPWAPLYTRPEPAEADRG